MTYEEMKQEVYNLDLESMEHGIKVREYDHPKRFEAAGLGIIDLSQIEYYGSIGLYEIYSGKWGTDSKKMIKRIVPDCNDTQYEQYLAMLKDIKAEYLKKRAEEKRKYVLETGYKSACKIVSSVPYQKRNLVREKENGYTWEDVKDRNINTIGYYWQAGVGTGTVDSHMIWFVYFGSLNKNDTFFTVAEITEQQYLNLCEKYKEHIYDDANGMPSKQVPNNVVEEIKDYVLHSKIIMEGWGLL